jgi:hypothetical protein
VRPPSVTAIGHQGLSLRDDEQQSSVAGSGLSEFARRRKRPALQN